MSQPPMQRADGTCPTLYMGFDRSIYADQTRAKLRMNGRETIHPHVWNDQHLAYHDWCEVCGLTRPKEPK